MTTEHKNKPSLRPADYTREIAFTICARRFDGESLSKICRDSAMPDKPTVMRWLDQQAEFREQYCFTLQLLVDELAAECISIVDTPNTECRERVRGAKVVTVSDREELARRSLRLKARHWLAERLLAEIARHSKSPNPKAVP